EVAGGALAYGEVAGSRHLPFERLDGSSDEAHLRGTLGADARGVHDGRRCANELDLPRALEQGLLGYQLAAARDVAQSCIGAIGEEVGGGPDGDEHGNRDDRDGDAGRTDDHSATERVGVCAWP